MRYIGVFFTTARAREVRESAPVLDVEAETTSSPSERATTDRSLVRERYDSFRNEQCDILWRISNDLWAMISKKINGKIIDLFSQRKVQNVNVNFSYLFQGYRLVIQHQLAMDIRAIAIFYRVSWSSSDVLRLYRTINCRDNSRFFFAEFLAAVGHDSSQLLL